jgi:hypothetical protein
VSTEKKLFSGAFCLAGIVLVAYGAFGPGQGAGTASGDFLNKLGFALLFFAIALALIFRYRKAR